MGGERGDPRGAGGLVIMAGGGWWSGWWVVDGTERWQGLVVGLVELVVVGFRMVLPLGDVVEGLP